MSGHDLLLEGDTCPACRTHELWLCECGQGDPAEHLICSGCGDDPTDCVCEHRSAPENQQTVEAQDAVMVAFDAVRDLAAQASRTQEWKQLAEDMGEALERHREWLLVNSDAISRDVCLEADALLARLHDLAAEQDAA